MIAANPIQTHSPKLFSAKSVKFRREVQSKEPAILAEIYLEETNIVIWQRELSTMLKDSVKDFLASNRTFQTVMTVTPQDALSSIRESLGVGSESELSTNIAELVDMFCCLFGLKHAGLRLSVLDRAMCPKFHVDKVPCRLVTTYQDIATEWLPEQAIDRTKLGAENNGLANIQPGHFQNRNIVQRLSSGDVALLKGELWEGNENAGLVHRSPALSDGEHRLLLTLDFIN